MADVIARSDAANAPPCLSAARDLVEDGARIGGPGEGLGPDIVILDDAAGRRLKVDDRAEYAPFALAPGSREKTVPTASCHQSHLVPDKPQLTRPVVRGGAGRHRRQPGPDAREERCCLAPTLTPLHQGVTCLVEAPLRWLAPRLIFHLTPTSVRLLAERGRDRLPGAYSVPAEARPLALDRRPAGRDPPLPRRTQRRPKPFT
jgi:hypothetical protein